MPNVRLKRGDDVWDILIPDVSEAQACEHALTLANGRDNGNRDVILATNGLSQAELHAQRRAVADGGMYEPPAKKDQWEVVEVLDDSEFPSTPDNIAAAEAAARGGSE